mmetsp:Transcript_4675/g.5771  ORF Transcript_4675/g.5771 Transcript_4675/m.5771 type:complete len:186 (+) Transcript_4675:1763-2320(+)
MIHLLWQISKFYLQVQVEAAIVFNAKRRKAEEEERKRERQRALVKARERAAAEERKRKAEIEAAAAARAHEKEILAASANSDQSQDDIQVDDTPPMYECAQCAIANSNMIAGAFSIADGGWYCADCWTLFAQVKETWQEEFGEETAPLFDSSPEDDNEESATIAGDEKNEGISSSSIDETVVEST